MYYLITLLVYGAVDAMACLGLSQQFGIAGVTNFGFIIFQAAGAYIAAIMALPPDTANGGFQLYIGGWNMPFPVPWVAAAVAGGVLALPFTFLVGRRLRGDFAAVGLLVTAVLLNLLVTNYRSLFNGDAGLALVNAPLRSGVFATMSNEYQWVFAAATVVLAAAVYWFVRRITESPYGRTLRAMRDNDKVADSLGKNLQSLRTVMLVVGGAIAGLSGGVLVSFISVWSPAAWSYAETIVLFAAVIIGVQTILFALFTKIFAISEGLLPADRRLDRAFRYVTLETGLVAGAILIALGFAGSLVALGIWSASSFGELDATNTLRLVVLSGAALALGSEIVLASFFLSVLGLRRR